MGERKKKKNTSAGDERKREGEGDNFELREDVMSIRVFASCFLLSSKRGKMSVIVLSVYIGFMGRFGGWLF